MTEPLTTRLRKRADIRRQIATRKSVQEGKPDRIADLLEEAAAALEVEKALHEATEKTFQQTRSALKACVEALEAVEGYWKTLCESSQWENEDHWFSAMRAFENKSRTLPASALSQAKEVLDAD